MKAAYKIAQEESADVSTFGEVLAHAKSELWRIVCGVAMTVLNAINGPAQALLLSAVLAV